MKLTSEDLLILSSIKINPTIIEIEKINTLISKVNNWDYFTTTIIDRGIGPLFYKKIPLLSNRNLIPQSVYVNLQQAYFKTFTRGVVLYEHFRVLGEALSLQEIPIIVLKGIYLSEWLYQDIGLRQFSDIDLLVNEKDGLTILSLLRDLGYSPVSTESNISQFVESQSEIVHYSPMVQNGVSIEIHIRLHQSAEKYNLNIDELWKNAISVKINNIHVLALNTTDLLIHLCVHLDKHFRTGHVQFTCFNDIVNVLENCSTKIDWNVLIEISKKYNCEKNVFLYILLVNRFMNAKVPNHIVQNYSILLKKNDIQLFYKYLNGYKSIVYANQIPAHTFNIKKLPKLSQKQKYIFDIIFPSKDFMLQKYHIKNSSLFLFYYPYRYWIGVKGIFKLILNRKNQINS
ncbi:MAG: nucleotidyltransferase family protein [Paludibacter sp.]|nr:nucleotidyltransferase family protein [Paludibacter sp.]